MAVLAGLYATEAPAAHVERIWVSLTAGLGAPVATAASGPFRASVYGRHEGERALSPAAATTGELTVGFGGDPRATKPEELVPPWAVCRYDPKRRTVQVETDRHGFALIYVRSLDGLVAFCSSAARLARVPPALERDRAAVAELLAFDHLLGERTLRIGVSALPQGHALEIGPSGHAFRRTFRYTDLPLRSDVSLASTADTLVETFRAAVGVALRQSGGGPVLMPLSGGLDSRMLAAAAIEGDASLDVFTFARAGAEGQLPDVAIAREVARRLGMPWRRLELTDHWLADEAARAAELTDGHLDVVHSYGIGLDRAFTPGRLRLDGLAGDVVLGGSFLDAKLLHASTQEDRIAAMWRARSRLDAPMWQQLLSADARSVMVATARASLAESIERDAEGPAARCDPRWSDFWILRHRIRRFASHGALLWEAVARSVFPFFEPRFFDHLMTVRPRLRADARLQRTVYQRGWPRLAEVAWQKTGRPLPPPGLRGLLARALQRRPQFPPGAAFYDFDAALVRSARLRDWIRDLLLDPTAAPALDGFDRAAIERLIADASMGKTKGMARLGVLLTLVLADRVWSPMP